jgi:hypothetical protein
MRDDGRKTPVKKIEYTIIDVLPRHTKFIDVLCQIVSGGPAEFMTLLSEPIDLHATFRLHFGWKLVEPLQQRNCPIVFSIEDYLNSGHPFAPIVTNLENMSKPFLQPVPAS